MVQSFDVLLDVRVSTCKKTAFICWQKKYEAKKKKKKKGTSLFERIYISAYTFLFKSSSLPPDRKSVLIKYCVELHPQRYIFFYYFFFKKKVQNHPPYRAC